MSTTTVLVVLVTVSILVSVGQARKTPSWPSPYWDIPGKFCSDRYESERCCPDRNDDCSAPILDTLCYCDQFCNRTDSDCCPDFFTHCEGLLDYKPNPVYVAGPSEVTVTRPTNCQHGVLEVTDPKCYVDGRVFGTRESIKINCNECKCQPSMSQPGCMELLCERNQCLVEEETLRELEAGRDIYTWRPANYSQFWARSLKDGISKKLGAIRPDYPVRHMTAVEFSYSPSSLPVSFDTREKWGPLVGGIQDQGWCAASWAFSTASVASDRISIRDDRRVELSPQSLLSCDTRGQAGCQGGHVDQAWNFLRKYGALPVECFPYTSAQGEISTCIVPRKRRIDTTSLNCPSLDHHKGLHKTQPAYRVGRTNTDKHPRRREQDIMYELMKQGPVQALMEVPTDFFMYKEGVYSRTNLAADTLAGYQAVKIVGWGEDLSSGRPQSFWEVANSWGNDWGDEGYFKIKRGNNECMIEEFVVGVWPRYNRNSRSRKRHNRRHTARFFSERSKPGRNGRGRHRRTHYQVG